MPARIGAGRPKGSIGKITAEAVAKAKEGGEMPLDYLLRVMRDKNAENARRDAAATAAASYCHPKLSAIEATVNATLTYEERLKALGA